MRMAALIFAVFAIVSHISGALAREDGTAKDTLRVGIAHAPPFVIETGDGEWTGIAVDLWREIANTIDRDYVLIPHDRGSLRDALRDGELDVGLSDLSITQSTLALTGFSRPYFHSELSAASIGTEPSSVSLILDALTSPGVLILVGILLALVLVVAVVFWVVEPKKDSMLYEDDHKRLNFTNGILWAILLITAQEPDIFKNRNIWGRYVAICVLFVGVTISASYIALIASTLTVSSLKTEVHGVEDLPRLHVGTLTESRGSEFLNEQHLAHKDYPTIGNAIDALLGGKIDVLIADAPVITYYLRRHSDARERVSMLRVHFETEYHGIAVAPGAGLLDPVNGAISELVESAEWPGIVQRYLGRDAGFTN